MKSLIEVINEGLFSKKKNNPLNLPDKMPKKYVDYFENYFQKNRDDIKDEIDVEEHLKYACDGFWNMAGAELWNPYKYKVDFDDYRACVYNKWKDQIIKIALK